MKTKATLELLAGLRLYQQQGVRFLVERDSALLADEMGLGKTVQTAVALQILSDGQKCKRVLIVCPASLSKNWEWELGRWAPRTAIRRIRGNSADRRAHFRLPFQIWVASYEQVRIDIGLLRKEPAFDLVVLDEAQRIKNIDSSIALVCRQLLCSRAWALTGTPVENRADDLLSIFAFLKPGLLHSGLSRGEVHRLIAPYFLRRRKKEVMKELPPIIVQDLMLEMGGQQRQAYCDARVAGLERVGGKYGSARTAGLLALITRLKQLCNFDVRSGESCKLAALQTILEGLNGREDKVLVFSQYVETMRWLKSRVNHMPIEMFHGGLSADEKARIVDTFERSAGPRLLLLSLRAGGVGLNLSTASTVVLFDRWWNPAVESQAIQRAHRFIRQGPLHVLRFLIMMGVRS